MTDLLKNIDSPADLRRLQRTDLPQLADELRHCVLDNVSKTGGHLSSNLGTVELTVALHYVFNTPEDRIVWDVGHQTYPHKILTGRRDRMGTLRQLGGVSGFPVRTESEYDAFGTAHSSTSISAALGMALAAKHKGEDRKSIAKELGEREGDPLPIALQLAEWGAGVGETLPWIDPPPAAGLREARQLLSQLQALDPQGHLTVHGRGMAQLGVHPRLAHMLLRAEFPTKIAVALALSECFP